MCTLAALGHFKAEPTWSRKIPCAGAAFGRAASATANGNLFKYIGPGALPVAMLLRALWPHGLLAFSATRCPCFLC
eukprot:8672783-Pyramimonas_sp.AAC.1